MLQTVFLWWSAVFLPTLSQKHGSFCSLLSDQLTECFPWNLWPSGHHSCSFLLSAPYGTKGRGAGWWPHIPHQPLHWTLHSSTGSSVSQCHLLTGRKGESEEEESPGSARHDDSSSRPARWLLTARLMQNWAEEQRRGAVRQWPLLGHPATPREGWRAAGYTCRKGHSQASQVKCLGWGQALFSMRLPLFVLSCS